MYKDEKQSKKKAQSTKKFKGKRIQNSKVLHCVPRFDRISDLPWPILDNILCRLPIQDAVGTSILSRKWRDKWVNLSKLVFDDRFGGYRQNVNCLVYAVYHVLLSHCGSIDTFKLSTHKAGFTDSDFDSWIHFLSRNGIKELTIEYVYSDCEFTYKLPPCLFSCQKLSHLHITKALLEPPDTFQGFKNLVHLQLDKYVNKNEVLASLICACPVLERLVLKNFENLALFSIQALKLKYFYLEGRFVLPIVLKNCPALVDISLIGHMLYSSEYQVQTESICQLVDDLSRLTNLERLNISSWFLSYLYRWDTDVSELSFTPSSPFKVLQIHSICYGDLYRTIMIASLFSNVQELHVSAEYEDLDGYLEKLEGHQRGCSFDRLQIVKIQLSQGNEHELELEFIKFVLACSPKLERMTIVNHDYCDAQIFFMKHLLSFERASAGARIVLLPRYLDVFYESDR